MIITVIAAGSGKGQIILDGVPEGAAVADVLDHPKVDLLDRVKTGSYKMTINEHPADLNTRLEHKAVLFLAAKTEGGGY